MSEAPVIDPSSIHLYRPAPNSCKGENGRLLVIGGSKLFHSSVFWSADAASRIVDLVHFTSPANENNELVRKKLKDGFWSGIVVDWGDVEHYIEEDDCALIGPGMVRADGRSGVTRFGVARHAFSSVEGSSYFSLNGRPSKNPNDISQKLITGGQFPKTVPPSRLHKWGKNDQTKEIVDYLLEKYPRKRWVVDGGALQEVDPHLINANMIITPNLKEFKLLSKKVDHKFSQDLSFPSPEQVSKISLAFEKCTVVVKGQTDIVCQGNHCVLNHTGNEGMTKGGTGDVLAGLIAALYTKNDPSMNSGQAAWAAATAGAYVNGLAGDRLKKRVGVYYNAGDLVSEIPNVLASLTS